MKTIERALSELTDLVSLNLPINIDDFKNQLTEGDFKEFKQLAAFVCLAHDEQQYSKDKKLFQKINSYKQSIYNTPVAANFRTDNDNSASAEATSNLDKLFDEEFKK